jgi:ATP-dependent RNA helicase RhlE
MSFSCFNLPDDLRKAIAEKGYKQASPIQLRAIPLILQGRDILARAQTGTGKTAAFALPILAQLSEQSTTKTSLRALILTPTRELALQVHQSFKDYGKYTQLTSGLAYGGVSVSVQVEALKSGLDILIATPGRLLDLLSQGALSLSQLQFLVLDEADRMLDMGFMDEIKRVLKHVPKKRQTLLFSATFDSSFLNFSQGLLTDPEQIEIDAQNTAAVQIEQMIYNTDEDRKRELVSYLIGSKNWQQVLIFTRTKVTADALAKEMCKDGIKALSIHGDKSQGARERALEEFKSGKTRALVATDVAARGLDISELKYVINYELPYIAGDYIHRIGRTGRAGGSGTAISLLSAGEEWLLEEVEAVLGERLPQQWLPGFEPDPNKTIHNKPSNKAAVKGRMKKRTKANKGSRGKASGKQRHR